MKPVSKTAYYCCGVRALDAASSSPVCGDHFAQRFMSSDAWIMFEPFRGLRRPNASNIARHRIIDDLLRTAIQSRPETAVVIIGAGFDTRAFRLPGGRWIELDEPAVIALKETLLPAHDAPNPLTRVPIAFDREPLGAALASFRNLSRTVVVLEGVLPYLYAAEVREMCRLEVDPLELIQAAGFRLTTRQSIMGRAVALGMLNFPRWLLATMLRSLRDGYTVATFEPC